MTRMLVLVAGLAGFAIVGKAAVYYRGVDGLAFGLTLLMGGALLAGLVELWRTASRVAELHGGLRGALAKADERPESLDAMPAPLRPVLRAHLERDPMPPRAPVFAPYLVGALVLLGLLGTFLGLFETLRGAREALSTSADVDALTGRLTTVWDDLQELRVAVALYANKVSIQCLSTERQEAIAEARAVFAMIRGQVH